MKKKKNKEIAAYIALITNILDPLQKWNFVTIDKGGKNKIVSLSTDEKKFFKICIAPYPPDLIVMIFQIII